MSATVGGRKNREKRKKVWHLTEGEVRSLWILTKKGNNCFLPCCIHRQSKERFSIYFSFLEKTDWWGIRKLYQFFSKCKNRFPPSWLRTQRLGEGGGAEWHGSTCSEWQTVRLNLQYIVEERKDISPHLSPLHCPPVGQPLRPRGSYKTPKNRD
jgi:hypothetical protein